MHRLHRFGWLIVLVAVIGMQALPRAASQPVQPLVRVIDAGQYPTLQAAFDAIPATGGVVRIPPGEYRIKEPLILSRGETRVEGSGTATKIVNLNQEGKPAFIVQPPNWEADKKTRIWRVQLADFRICGDPDAVDAKSTMPKSGDGLLCQGVQELYVSGLSVDHHGGNGIHLVDCYEDPRISDSIITYCRQTGVNIEGCHDIVVNANQFEENQDALRCADSFNLCMSGNNIDDHLGNGVIIENTYGSVVSGNMIEECDGTAIILDRDCYGITLGSNVIAHHQTGGVDLRDAWGCTVSANTFVLCNKSSLMIGPNSGRIAVTGNTFCNSDIGEGKTKRPREHQNAISRDLAFGVHLDSTTDIALTGNVFSGLRDAAIQTKGDCRRIVVVGNAVADVSQDDADGQRIDLSAAKDAVFAENSVETP
ncbi:MAG TPA: right-handed parallel beta-helix repeat-containing protein [Planctomycetaceae bacterium]|nr:right-handed parallel beta-helix repeat-containing protein [Planctomycetaceae bacterium]